MERPLPVLGLMVDGGVPDGATVSAVYRPFSWLRTEVGASLVKAAVDAVEEGQRMQGRNVKKWAYGKYIELTITHPVTHLLPLVGSYFDIGPVPMSGSSTCRWRTG